MKVDENTMTELLGSMEDHVEVGGWAFVTTLICDTVRCSLPQCPDDAWLLEEERIVFA